MPRMPKKRKLELSFFLNERGRVTYNDLCRKCQRTCKQSFRAVIVDHFPIMELAAALARSTMTVKRSLNELEDAGLILRVRQGFGEPNKIYVLIPKKEDSRL